jgi:NAD(P)-dependent dehydrogenase (short-subunit alcohol dehydrogenase family)
MAEKKKAGQFTGKVVIVTGSSAGIGQATAVAFGREGASVVIHGQDAGRLQKTHDIMVAEGVDPKRILQVIGSMEAAETPDKIHRATVDKFQRLDVLVNNAGAMQKLGTTDEGSAENLEYLFRANLLSAVRLMQLCMPELEKTHGCVVNVSSVVSTRSFTSLTSYSAMKAALDLFTRNYAAKYGPRGVRINSLKWVCCPWCITTAR